MIFRRFKFSTTLRVIGLAITAGLLSWLVVNTTLYASMGVVLILLIWQTYSLIYYVDRSNRDLV
ncbi:MAG: hypothetical protein V3T31_12640 [candidate division Zixibacteria bacterium]